MFRRIDTLARFFSTLSLQVAVNSQANVHPHEDGISSPLHAGKGCPFAMSVEEYLKDENGIIRSVECKFSREQWIIRWTVQYSW